jgi:hypothetical protein
MDDKQTEKTPKRRLIKLALVISLGFNILVLGYPTTFGQTARFLCWDCGRIFERWMMKANKDCVTGSKKAAARSTPGGLNFAPTSWPCPKL